MGVRRLLAFAAVVVALTWGAILMRAREAADREPPPRPALRMWGMPGCYRISGDPWPEGVEEAVGLPDHVMLVPDSLDEWGRVYETYRAEPLDVEDDRAYRWFVRADTLWLVWSDAGVRGGLALRESADRLLGRVRVGGAGSGADATARVEAWKVNCATREIESTSRVRR
ncbi:MAG: hypothetical protein R3195_13970 [Gemmatimonadota bacterium]|nr:hypothetical protein [Gemmatimonadota bacterium]